MYVEYLDFTVKNLNQARFVKGFKEEVASHEIFRSHFVWQGVKNPVQVVMRELGIEYREENWEKKSKKEQKEALRKIKQEEQRREFNIEKDPLIRLYYIHLGVEKCQIIFLFHHSEI